MALFIFIIVLIVIILAIKKNNSSSTQTHSQRATALDKSRLHGNRCFTTSTHGEYELLQLLKKELDVEEYYMFNDLIVPNGSNSTSEIDHVVISSHGIFVIENKDYTGWIFGQSHQKKWTQVIKGGKKYSHQNPLHQNYGHKKALQSALPFIDQSRFYSIVAFSRRAEFKTDIPNDVFFYDQVPDVIKSITDERIDKQRVLLTIGKLSHLCQQPSSDRKNHINNVEEKFSET